MAPFCMEQWYLTRLDVCLVSQEVYKMANFDQALAYVGINEGGFQKNPKDPGNWYNGELLGTNHGISAPVAREHGYLGRMEDLPKAFADAIYQTTYWPGLDAVADQAIATKILDMRVQFGPAGGARLAQAALRRLGASISADGVIGPMTVAAINAAYPEALMERLCIEMDSAYRADVARNPEKQTFLNGWLKRAAKIPSGYYIAAAGGSLVGLVVVGVAAWLLVTT